MDVRGHGPGEGVIIASKSIHAAIMKASQAYLVKLILIDTDHIGRINLNHLREEVKRYGKRVIVIIGSAPSYPTGVIDPIRGMALIAKENGCGMHVDCCLGAQSNCVASSFLTSLRDVIQLSLLIILICMILGS